MAENTHKGEGGGITDPAHPARFMHVMEGALATEDGVILCKVARPILDHLAEDGSGPVLLVGAEQQEDGTWELTFKRLDPNSWKRGYEARVRLDQLKAAAKAFLAEFDANEESWGGETVERFRAALDES